MFESALKQIVWRWPQQSLPSHIVSRTLSLPHQRVESSSWTREGLCSCIAGKPLNLPQPTMNDKSNAIWLLRPAQKTAMHPHFILFGWLLLEISYYAVRKPKKPAESSMWRGTEASHPLSSWASGGQPASTCRMDHTQIYCMEQRWASFQLNSVQGAHTWSKWMTVTVSNC